MQSAASRKRQRATRACDFCHSRGLKCRQGGTNLTAGLSENVLSVGCLTCADYGVECTINRPLRKRGRRKPSQSAAGDSIEAGNGSTARRSKTKPLDESKFGSQDVIRRLVQIYHDTMYPKYGSSHLDLSYPMLIF